MLGETANIKRNNLLYGQILILKEKMPYYSSDKKRYTKIENINEKNLMKYFKLGTDNFDNLFHKPDIFFIAFIKTGDESRISDAIENSEYIADKKAFNINNLLPLVESNGITLIKPENLDEKFSEEMIEFLNRHSDFEKFIDAFVYFTKAKTYGR